MRHAYKYEPAHFVGILGLPNELNQFYQLHEKYVNTKSYEDRFALENHWENLLFFTIKHREVEGSISPPLASDMRTYLEELLYDRL